MVKTLTRAGLNADENSSYPLPSEHFVSSVDNFCVKHHLPSKFAANAVDLTRRCLAGVWLGGKYPGNAEAGALLYLL